MHEPGESPVLAALAESRVTREDAFAGLYREYGRLTRAWLALRVPPADVDDLLQDVWSVFWRRWRDWTQPAGVAAADPRPLLGFLFRTCHLTVQAHRRLLATRAAQPLEETPDPAIDGQGALVRHVQLGECLSAAQACCDDADLAVLTAKLSGLSGRDIAHALGISEATVDHRYRATLGRIRARIAATAAMPPRERSHDE